MCIILNRLLYYSIAYIIYKYIYSIYLPLVVLSNIMLFKYIHITTFISIEMYE